MTTEKIGYEDEYKKALYRIQEANQCIKRIKEYSDVKLIKLELKYVVAGNIKFARKTIRQISDKYGEEEMGESKKLFNYFQGQIRELSEKIKSLERLTKK